MANSQIDSLSVLIEAAVRVEQAPQPSPSTIKIRFKKGALSPKSANKVTGEATMMSPLVIGPSPGSEKKRKVIVDADLEIDGHVVKRTKIEKSGETMPNIATDGSCSIKKATTPTSSMATTGTSTGSPKKAPVQAASIYRKLANKLSTQPVLLEHLKEYRTCITNQHREDIKLITSLKVELSATTKEAEMKELLAAEELKASKDMVLFWTDSCNDEHESTMLLKEKLRDIVDKIEVIANADAMGDVHAGFSKGMSIEFELQKLGAELSNLVEERKERAT